MGISPKMRDEKPSINTVQFESESTVYLGAKIWELIPENIESSESVEKTNKKSRWNVCQYSGFIQKPITTDLLQMESVDNLKKGPIVLQ